MVGVTETPNLGDPDGTGTASIHLRQGQGRVCVAFTLKNIKEAKEGKKDAPSEFAMARTYHQQGLRNDEKRAYLRCLKYDGKFPPCHFGLFEIFKDDRDDKNAKTACQNFLKFAEGSEYVKEVETCERYVSANTY